MDNFCLWQVTGPGQLTHLPVSIRSTADKIQIIDENNNVIQEGNSSNWSIIKLLHCGLCSTDIASLSGLFSFPLPLTIGHEIIGTDTKT